jgi:hypothetical protein
MKKQLILYFLAITIFLSCKKEENTSTDFNSYFILTTYGTSKKDAPHAYLKEEGYDNVRKIYYLSVTFATGAVTFDTTTKAFKGYGEAVRYYFYSPSKTEITAGNYPYTNPLNTTNPFFQTQKVEVFSNNYSFNYTTNQQGRFYNKTNSGLINFVKNGSTYDISYVADVGYSNGSTFLPIIVSGEFKGVLVK